MIPQFTIGEVIFNSYHLINLLAIITFSIYLFLITKKIFLTNSESLFFVCSLLIFALIGSKILHIAEGFFTDLSSDFFDITAGFVLYGGLFSMILLTVVFEIKKGVKSFELLDKLVKAFCILIGIGKFSCIAAGCCYGYPTNNKYLNLFFQMLSVLLTLRTNLYLLFN